MTLQELLSTPVSNIPDLTAVEAGEHQLTCVDTKYGISTKNGKPYGLLYFAVEGKTFVKRISYMLPVFSLADEDAEKYIESAKTKLRNIVLAFNIRESMSLADLATDTEKTLAEFLGKSAWAVVTVKDDAEYGPTNDIKRWTKSA